MKQFNISIVGCGFICDYYIKTFENYPNVKIAGVWDHVETRRDHIATTFNVPAYSDFESLLADESTCLVVNLTNSSKSLRYFESFTPRRKARLFGKATRYGARACRRAFRSGGG